MRLGMHLREASQHKLGLAIVLLIALLVAARVYGFGLLPPTAPTAPEGQATARILVDTPRSTMLDLRESTYDLLELNNRALLVGNAMASVAVRERIARKIGVSPDEIAIETPLTTEYATKGVGGGAPPVAHSEYLLDVQATPTVPAIDVGATAPSSEEAVALADAASEALTAYVAGLPSDQRGPEHTRVKVRPLGSAEALPTSDANRLLPAVIAFLLVFAAGSATVVFVSRRRREFSAASRGLEPTRPL